MKETISRAEVNRADRELENNAYKKELLNAVYEMDELIDEIGMNPVERERQQDRVEVLVNFIKERL